MAQESPLSAGQFQKGSMAGVGPQNQLESGIWIWLKSRFRCGSDALPLLSSAC